MPLVRLVYYREDDGTIPIVEWLAKLPRQAIAKSLAYLARLEANGYDLRRPVADYLRDGIYELRPSVAGVQFRILYFFHGNQTVVVSHGLKKERKVPKVEIERVIERMKRFTSNPSGHTFVPAKGD